MKNYNKQNNIKEIKAYMQKQKLKEVKKTQKRNHDKKTNYGDFDFGPFNNYLDLSNIFSSMSTTSNVSLLTLLKTSVAAKAMLIAHLVIHSYTREEAEIFADDLILKLEHDEELEKDDDTELELKR